MCTVFVGLTESDCNHPRQTAIEWRQVASRQVTCAIALRLKVIIQRLKVLNVHPLGDQLVISTACNHL